LNIEFRVIFQQYAQVKTCALQKNKKIFLLFQQALTNTGHFFLNQKLSKTRKFSVRVEGHINLKVKAKNSKVRNAFGGIFLLERFNAI